MKKKTKRPNAGPYVQEYWREEGVTISISLCRYQDGTLDARAAAEFIRGQRGVWVHLVSSPQDDPDAALAEILKAALKYVKRKKPITSLRRDTREWTWGNLGGIITYSEEQKEVSE